jgi:alpha-galactosidase
MRFGLYWTDSENKATPQGRKTCAGRIKRLFVEHGADIWRSDCTVGNAIEADYWSVKGFYEMVDGLQREVPGFQWENCHGGGRIKDYGAMKRSVKIFGSDGFSALDVRRTFYDSSYALHPVQLMGHLGFFNPSPRKKDWIKLKKDRPRGAAGMRYAFRAMSMGAPQWFIGPPGGGDAIGGSWTEAELDAVRVAVATYKSRIRPLVRNADLFHIFPRPDDKVWDGIQYYDPASGKGVVFIFKPASPDNARTIKLKGLDADRRYRLTFEDGSNPEAAMAGDVLMRNGIVVSLEGAFVSELMFIEAIAK